MKQLITFIPSHNPLHDKDLLSWDDIKNVPGNYRLKHDCTEFKNVKIVVNDRREIYFTIIDNGHLSVEITDDSWKGYTYYRVNDQIEYLDFHDINDTEGLYRIFEFYSSKEYTDQRLLIQKGPSMIVIWSRPEINNTFITPAEYEHTKNYASGRYKFLKSNESIKIDISY